MRLLKTGPYEPGTEKLELIEKWGADIPHYAILSHTWSSKPEDEVLFADIRGGTVDSKPAYRKLEQAMKRAMLDGYGWLWIDTCCIDMSSSVELSEAINSMYSYYKNAGKCYAYLADVNALDSWAGFERSRWWRRGWTLQELLAPSNLEFFASDWTSLGHKDALRPSISGITGIDEDYLRSAPPASHTRMNGEKDPGGLSLPVEHASLAKRMSWAANRQTTREEDLAYCLIGLFEVNMPMLYGEGSRRAFHRLQEEIMRVNEDQSLFAWVKTEDDGTSVNGLHGLLADSPRDFQLTGSVVPYSVLTNYSVTTVTARGLNVTLPLTQIADGKVIAALQCPPQGRQSGFLSVHLQKLNIGSNVFARTDCDKLASIPERGNPQAIYVRQPPNFEPRVVCPYHYFEVRHINVSSETPDLAKYFVSDVGMEAQRPWPIEQAQPGNDSPLVRRIDKTEGALTAAMHFRRVRDGQSFQLLLGAGRELSVGFALCKREDGHSMEQLQRIFTPQPAGLYMVLDFHTVRVQVEERVHLEQRTYFLDITIIARPVVSTNVERRAVKGALLGQMKRFRLT